MRRGRLRRFKKSSLIASSLLNNLVSFWNLGEATGATRVDSTASAFNMSDIGTVDQATGKIGNCVDFDGSADNLERAATTWGFGNTFTISCWYKQDLAANDKTILQLGPSITVGSPSAIRLVSNYVYFVDNASSNTFKFYGNLVTSTNWIHRVVTWDGTTLNIYHDTTLLSPTKVFDAAGSMSDDSRVGYMGVAVEAGAVKNRYFAGLVDAIGIWSRVITSAEITLLYNSGNGREWDFS